MITFLTILAGISSFAIFLYLLAGWDNREMDKSSKNRESKEKELNQKRMDPKKVYSKDWDPKLPRPRICPMCGTFLSQNEYLFASLGNETNSEGKKQAHIYGCKYCYLGMEKSPESVQELEDV